MSEREIKPFGPHEDPATCKHEWEPHLWESERRCIARGNRGQMIIKFDNFKKSDGLVDWHAYKQEQIKNGEICYQCNRIAKIIGTGNKELCYSCKQFSSSEETTHDDFIRCPKCGHLDKISDWDCDYGEEKYQDGDHDVHCNFCEHKYIIETHVSYSYTSPSRIDQ